MKRTSRCRLPSASAVTAASILSALIEAVIDNAAVGQALLDWPGFIIDGTKALPKAIRKTFGRTPIQRYQVHKARNVTSDLPNPPHERARTQALRQAWQLDDAEKGEKLIHHRGRLINDRF